MKKSLSIEDKKLINQARLQFGNVIITFPINEGHNMKKSLSIEDKKLINQARKDLQSDNRNIREKARHTLFKYNLRK